MKKAEYVSRALIRFEKVSWDIYHLFDIHDTLMAIPPAARRQEKADILHRSTFLFVTACWESYVEDLCSQALLCLLVSGAKRRMWIGSVLKAQMDQRIKSFNTPNSKNINELFQATIGIVKLTDCWWWQGITSHQSSIKLGNYVKIRGEIAHRTRTSTPITKVDSETYFEFIRTLVAKTERRVQTYVKRKSGHGFGKVIRLYRRKRG